MEDKLTYDKENENPTLGEVIEAKDTEMKEWIVNYVGEKVNPDNEEVTVQMVVEALADEFPELVLPLVEENFIRGYQQAMDDIEAGEKILQNMRNETESVKGEE